MAITSRAITSAGEAGQAPGPVWKRIGWLVLIWTLSVAALGVVAYAIRLATDHARPATSTNS
jgi:hypothetical protein